MNKTTIWLMGFYIGFLFSMSLSALFKKVSDWKGVLIYFGFCILLMFFNLTIDKFVNSGDGEE